MKKILINLILISIFSTIGLSQEGTKESKWTEAKIKSSVVCNMCKANIKNGLAFTKGVKSADVDLKTKEIIVVFNNKKTTLDEIKIAITKMGYDADNLKADAKAYEKLEDCCKNPEGCKEEK